MLRGNLDTLAKDQRAPHGAWEKINRLIEGVNKKKSIPDNPVPESAATVKVQMDWLTGGRRDVAFFTPGTELPAVPDGFAKLTTERGTFIYNPEKVTKQQLADAVKNDTLGDVLGYGIPNKPSDANMTGVVVLRGADGTEKLSVVTDAEHQEQVVKNLQALADEGDTLSLEHPQTVTNERQRNTTAEQVQTVWNKIAEKLGVIKSQIREGKTSDKNGSGFQVNPYYVNGEPLFEVVFDRAKVEKLYADFVAAGGEETYNDWLGSAMDEEYRHVLQFETSKRLWNEGGREGSFQEFHDRRMTELKASVDEKDLAAAGKIYGKQFDRLTDSQQMAEFMRMLAQGKMKMTELATDTLNTLGKYVKQLMATLEAALTGKGSEAVRDEYQRLQALDAEIEAELARRDTAGEGVAEAQQRNDQLKQQFPGLSEEQTRVAADDAPFAANPLDNHGRGWQNNNLNEKTPSSGVSRTRRIESAVRAVRGGASQNLGEQHPSRNQGASGEGFFRRTLGQVGEVEQRRRLWQHAADNNLLLPENYRRGEKIDDRGGEHAVFYRPDGRVEKVTHAPAQGGIPWLPLDYLENMAKHNLLEPALDWRLEGVRPNADGSLSFVTSQKFFDGDARETPENSAALRRYLRQSGWEAYPHAGMSAEQAKRWRHLETGAVISDVSPKNMLRLADGRFAPIDVRVEELPDWERATADADLAERIANALSYNPAKGLSKTEPTQFTNATVVPPDALFAAKPAYHGTPHKVDKFRTAYIGTGEGAQVYGWGLYFAENMAVGDIYRKTLAARQTNTAEFYDGKPVPAGADAIAVRLLRENGGNIRLALQQAAAEFPGLSSLGRITDLINILDPKKIQMERGNLYRVELNVEDGELLDWDGVLADQHEIIARLEQTDWWSYAKDRLEDLPHNASGKELYGDLLHDYDKREASELLAAAGIKGIKYLDGNSRAAAEGTSNYVIFDERDIKITHENDVPVGEGLHTATPQLTADARRQYEDVVQQYTNPDGTKKAGWLKAPNGAATNLTERQWVQTRTPAFNGWFGDWERDPKNASKVVDENGEPLTAWRGYVGDYVTVFDTKQDGIHFSNERDYAESYSTRDYDRYDENGNEYGNNLQDAFLNLKKVLDLREVSGKDDLLKRFDAIGFPRDKKINPYEWSQNPDFNRLLTIEEIAELLDDEKKNWLETDSEGYRSFNPNMDLTDKLGRFLKGYADGIIFPEHGNTRGGLSYVVFDNANIKSATANTGAFSGSDASILHAATPSFETQVSPTLARDVRAALNTDRASGTVMREHAVVNFSNTPPLLRFLLLPDASIISSVDRIRKMQRNHGLTAEQIAAFPEKYSDPIAVFKEPNGSYAVVTDEVAAGDDGRRRSVIVYLRPEPGKNNLIASAYAPNEDKARHYQQYAKSENLLYFNQEKAAAIERQEGLSLQLRPDANNSGLQKAFGSGLQDGLNLQLRPASKTVSPLTPEQYTAWRESQAPSSPSAAGPEPTLREVPDTNPLMAATPNPNQGANDAELQRLMSKHRTAPGGVSPLLLGLHHLGEVTDPEAAPVKYDPAKKEMPPFELREPIRTDIKKTGAIARALDGVKALHKEATTLKRHGDAQIILNRMAGDFQVTQVEATALSKEIIGKIKDKTARQGLTHWIEAGGSDDVLRQRLDEAKSPLLKKTLEAALKLTDAQKAVAKDVAEIFSLLAQREAQWGLNYEQLENYVTHLWRKPSGGIGATGKTLNSGLGYAKARYYDTMFDGMQAGLEPATLDLADILAARVDASGNETSMFVIRARFLQGEHGGN